MDDHWLRVATAVDFSSATVWHTIQLGVAVVYDAVLCIASFYDAKHGS